MTGRTGVFPGSFNPPTVAHLAIAEAVRAAHHLDIVEFTLSLQPLGKPGATRPGVEERGELLEAVATRIDWLRVRITAHRLLADIAEGYDVIVMGADKWHQIHDLQFYGGSRTARDAALARLPTIAVVPRHDLPTPPELTLELGAEFRDVSSSMARSGRQDLMLPEARRRLAERGSWG